MPRGNRHFLPGHVWHITHRCHDRTFLLKFTKDRNAWQGWLFQAKVRHGLEILNFTVTCNHIHLLAYDTGNDVIARSMQLVAGCTGQSYNDRRGRHGAFWEGRYHATAVEDGEHFLRCLVYIDLNMVRAGVVNHPTDWAWGGYRELQAPPKRYRLINAERLAWLAGSASEEAFRRDHRDWVEHALQSRDLQRDVRWTEGIAVGSESFVKAVQLKLGTRATGRRAEETEHGYVLREDIEPDLIR